MKTNTILCLHGAFLNGHMFDCLRKAVEAQTDAEIKFFTPTLLGHGTNSTERLTYAKQAAWLEENYGYTKPILLGHSMGAGIAMQCALQWSCPIEALFLCGAGIGKPNGPNTTQGFLARGIKPELSSDFVAQMVKGWFFNKKHDLAAILRKQILDLSKSQFDEIQASLLRGLDQKKRNLKDLQIKATILHGREDQNRSLKEAYDLADCLKGELIIFEECGHMVPIEMVEALTKKLVFQINYGNNQ